MASNLTVDTLTKGATTLNTDELVDVNNTRVAKAWVNFNGTGTVAIRASFNISSITDNGTGDYTINFTTATADVNYAAIGNSTNTTLANAGSVMLPKIYATSSVRVQTGYVTNTSVIVDEPINTLAIFR